MKAILIVCLPFLTGALPAQLFGSPQVFPLPADDGGAVDMALGDIDGDGVPDLVTLDPTRVRVLRGDGAGGLLPAIVPTLPGPTVYASRLQLLDSDGDGHLDIWFSHAFGAVALLGDGAGGFVGSVPVPGLNQALVFADWNGDGLPDLASGSHSGVGISLRTGSGFGPLTTVPLPIGTANAVAAGDIDGDGDLDLVCVGGLITQLFVLVGDGAGGFTVQGPAVDVGLLGSSVWLADVNGDGAPDVLTSTGTSGLQLRLNNGVGQFGAVAATWPHAASLAVVDVDGDGHVDLLRGTSQGLAVHRGSGADGFATAQVFGTGPYGAVAAGDLDGDGRIDGVAASIGAAQVSVLRNQLPTPHGIAPFGRGTPGCDGTMGIWGTPEPTIGEAGFVVLCSNVPPNAQGLLAIGTRVTNGWQLPGLGLTLHLGLALPLGTMHSDVGGVARYPLPIPAVAFLAGLRVNVQSFWVGDRGAGDTCSPAAYELASSRGLSITLQR